MGREFKGRESRGGLKVAEEGGSEVVGILSALETVEVECGMSP